MTMKKRRHWVFVGVMVSGMSAVWAVRGLAGPPEARGIAMDVDPSGNGVLEISDAPVTIEPRWLNVSATSLPGATGVLCSRDAKLSVGDGSGDYGTINTDGTASCSDTGNCYTADIDNATVRPSAHWDLRIAETLTSTGTTAGWKVWPLHVGNSFADVPTTNAFYRHIETLFHNGITAGCGVNAAGNALFCPDSQTTRAQMAAFVATTMAGALIPVSGSSSTPSCTYNCVSGGTSCFSDVLPTDPFCKSIHYIYVNGVTSGCGGGNYCPTALMPRWQMAAFVASDLTCNSIPRTGSVDGCSYNCATGGTSCFTDVAPTDAYCPAVHFVAANAIASSCGTGQFCPTQNITRKEMAEFLVNGYDLQLYGP
jgi:hypothetical protein